MKNVLFVLQIFLIMSCKEKPRMADIDINADNISSSSFMVFAKIGDGVAEDYNFVVSTQKGATTSDIKYFQEGSRDSVTGYFPQLEPNTEYYVKMHITGESQTKYSEEIVIKTKEKKTFIDQRDNQEYEYVEIESQTWMAQNLNYFVEGQSVYYNNDEKYSKYGRLYKWEIVHSVCPEGWHLPNNDEWNELEKSIGVYYDVNYQRKNTFNGSHLRTIDSINWKDYYYGTNKTGFNAIGSGAYSSFLQNYVDINVNACYWVSISQSYPNIGYINNDGKIFLASFVSKDNMLSVRCVKD